MRIYKAQDLETKAKNVKTWHREWVRSIT